MWQQVQHVSHPELVSFDVTVSLGSSGVAFGRWAEQERAADKSAAMSNRCGGEILGWEASKQLLVSESASRRMKREEANRDKVAGRLKRLRK